MVPGVGHHNGGVDATTDTRGPLKEKFLGNHGDQSGHQGNQAWLGDVVAFDIGDDFAGTVPQNAEADGKEHQSDGGRGEGFILAVSKIVVGIAGFSGDAHEEHDNQIGHEVGKRVYGIGNHGRTAAQHAGDKFEEQQQKIDEAAHKRHAEDEMLALLVFYCFGHD